MRYQENDRVVIVKSGDKHEGKHGFIESIESLVHFPVSIFAIRLDDGSKRDYFYSDIRHE